MKTRYAIYSGLFGKDETLCLESVEAPDAAYHRMEEIASDQPGKYFLLSLETNEAVGSIRHNHTRPIPWSRRDIGPFTPEMKMASLRSRAA